MYKSILLAADGSDNSFRAAKETLNFINENTKVTILNVIQVEKSKDAILHGEDIVREQKEKLADIMRLYENENVTYNVIFERGIPDETVVKAANDGGFNIIVLGNRGLNALQGMMMGSVSHKVAKRANIPVLIVK
ncbi:Nucleotide-binding universal stress protein, UspA family [Jeotgalicoccus aerolatus]|jgi:nucleotide-binding universal stress UspA family protein|uniref:Nucleotide-binding universal stress protein, UspA family n=1 Tax=Jeotgalicoccus aerolatus TaxID=709510 RepID=A0A1G8XLB7_9STAP|nr:universal stress protein [Jeotgalicoccus aerolatus]NMA81315.1 universal stress protein [Jeotgalicoccus aerolatus]SDJ91361.1 Nucleotide-binding universal stress protein, UspA family [Jeotgalicoccus aerolatus]